MSPLAHWLDVAVSDRMLYIRVSGLGDMRLASLLSDVSDHWMHEGPRDILVALGACTGLDSTFMGTLLRLSESAELVTRQLRIMDVPPICRKCLETLGIDQLLHLEEHLAVPELTLERLHPEPSSRAMQLQVIRTAHIRLVAANAENRVRFGPFLDALDRELSARRDKMPVELDDMGDAEDVDTSEIDPV